MVYRKTEKVLAGIENGRAKIIATAIDMIAKSGFDGFGTNTVAKRGKVSVGLVYKHFPDIVELRAAVIAQLLARDLAAIREAGPLDQALRAWAKRLSGNYRLMNAIGSTPAYRAGIRAELQRLIKAAGASEGAAMLSAVAYGAIFEAAGSLRPRDEEALVAALLRSMGLRHNAGRHGQRQTSRSTF